MPGKWDKSSKNDFNKAAAPPPMKDKFNDKAKSGNGDVGLKPKGTQDQPKPELRPPGMGSTSSRTAWDRTKEQRTERQGPSKAGQAVSKDDPKLSRNFNSRAKT